MHVGPYKKKVQKKIKFGICIPIRGAGGRQVRRSYLCSAREYCDESLVGNCFYRKITRLISAICHAQELDGSLNSRYC